MTHRGDVSEEGIQFLISVEDAVVHEVIGGLDRAYALAPCASSWLVSGAIGGDRSNSQTDSAGSIPVTCSHW
jgi:hypothetical protein